MSATTDPGLISQLRERPAKPSVIGASVRTAGKAESSSPWERVGKRNLGLIRLITFSQEVITRTEITILSDLFVLGTLLLYLI